VISPLPANNCLHHALDLWANRWRQREAIGDMIVVRYADDIVVELEDEADARGSLDKMGARLEEFALTLHPEKARLIEFGRRPAGFCCGGRSAWRPQPRRDWMQAKLVALKEEPRRRRHQPIPRQGEWLRGCSVDVSTTPQCRPIPALS